jgi:peptide chain release factor 2
MQKQSRLRQEIERWAALARRIQDSIELAELDDPDMLAELAPEVDELAQVVEKMAFQTMLGGAYDNESAMIAIHAGAGGVDAQDWAAMLLRMYLRWAERRGYSVEIVEETPGEEAGIKSATLSIGGEYASGYLQSERGVHRLVRLSPYDAANRRHTSFALVEMWPDIQGEIDIEIAPTEIQVDTYRSSGAGGQNVQKNETAIRITHLPTGIVVTCQNQRSQLQNKIRAMQVLKSRLLDMERQKQEDTMNSLRGQHVAADFGNAVRSYVLHPYQLVKDTRSNYETAQTQKVLDGELDAIMEAYLKFKVSGE